VSLTVVEQPTLDQLIRHARLFGTEGVFETGEQEGLSSAALARLRIATRKRQASIRPSLDSCLTAPSAVSRHERGRWGYPPHRNAYLTR
jgi:hypothetical protein